MTLRSSIRRTTLVLASAAALVASLTTTATAAPAAKSGMTCELLDLSVPGTVTDAQAIPAAGTSTGDYTIRSEYCRPAKGPAPKVVLLALHGITYTHTYWNPGFQDDTYSFAQAMTKAGYATLALDRLGYGDSSHPASPLVTLDSQAAVAHEVIKQLRAGQVADTSFKRVVLVGHSYGSATSWRESAQFNDADAIIATGWGSTIQTQPLARFFTGFYPSAVDPKFAGKGYDPGYFTPMPGTRAMDFLYDLNNADPAMLDYDYNTLRDTVTGGEAFTFYNRYGAIPVAPSFELPLSDQTKSIKIPVFLINGENELFFCGPSQSHCESSQALQKAESQYFSPSACFRATSIPDAGHDLNLQRNAPMTYQAVLTYLGQAFGTDGSKLDSYKSGCSAYSGANTGSGNTFGPFGG